MIIEMIGTISAEVRSMEDPKLISFLAKLPVKSGDALIPEVVCVIHGKVTDVYRVIAR